MPPATDKMGSPVDEYKDLRAEILQSQQIRWLVLGFTFTALGVLGGIALARANRGDQDLIAGALGFAALVICAAGYLTTVLTQRIDRLADYIQAHLEPQLGYGWESEWRKYRARVGKMQWRPLVRWLRPTLPLGTSKPLAVYYFALAAADGAAYAAAAKDPPLWGIVVVGSLVMLAAYLAANLFFRFTWHLGWTPLSENSPRRRWRR